MLKGDIDFFVAAMIFTTGIIMILLFFNAGFARTEAILVSAQEKLNVIDASHFIKGCLEEDGLIKEESLDAAFLNLKANCPIGGELFVTASDRDDPSKTWLFGTEKRGVSHTVPFSLLRKDSGDIHVGELYVVL